MEYNKEELTKAIEQSLEAVTDYLARNNYVIELGQPDDDGDIMVTTYSNTLGKDIIMGYINDNDSNYTRDRQQLDEALENTAQQLIDFNNEAMELSEKFNLN